MTPAALLRLIALRRRAGANLITAAAWAIGVAWRSWQTSHRPHSEEKGSR